MSKLEDFFSEKHRHSRHHGAPHDRYAGHPDRRYGSAPGWDNMFGTQARTDKAYHAGPSMVQKLIQNRTALVFLALFVLTALVGVTALLAFMLPLLPKLLVPLQENGIQGLVEQGIQIMGKLWLGSGK